MCLWLSHDGLMGKVMYICIMYNHVPFERKSFISYSIGFLLIPGFRLETEDLVKCESNEFFIFGICVPLFLYQSSSKLIDTLL